MTIIRGTPPKQFENGDGGKHTREYSVYQAEQEENVVEEKRQVRLRKAFSLATDLGFTKEQRYELAQMLPGVDKDDGGSWKVLNPKQLHDLITMMEGYVYIRFMLDRDS
jgi:hypothetical protein